MKYEINFWQGAVAEYRRLDGSQKVFVNKALARLQLLGMAYGQPLSGPLAGCHKLKNKKQGLRIVFRKSSQGIEVIDIVAIGKRADKEVYETINNTQK